MFSGILHCLDGTDVVRVATDEDGSIVDAFVRHREHVDGDPNVNAFLDYTATPSNEPAQPDLEIRNTTERVEKPLLVLISNRIVLPNDGRTVVIGPHEISGADHQFSKFSKIQVRPVQDILQGVV